MFHVVRFITVPTLAALALLGGCDNSDDRVGQWTLDIESMEAEMAAQAPEENADFALQMMKSMNMQLQTNADQSFEMTATMFGETTRVKGAWDPIDSGLLLSKMSKDGQEPSDEKATATLVDDDHLRITKEGDDDVMLFVRVENDS